VNFLTNVSVLTFALNALIFIVVLFANKEALSRLRKLLKILDNGSFHDCPYYKHKLGEYEENTKERR
jgi:hypothetical protein